AITNAPWAPLASPTFTGAITGDGFRTPAGEGITVTNDVIVSGGTTNRMVFSGGILISNITNFY
ncbi:MAG: hypothetical protein JZU63_03505, partial [Rhodoferax sp.]|nr:hypothetical protein [Rhodoferax sp.]